MSQNKKNYVILGVTAIVLLAIIIFSLFNWHTISYLFTQMTTGVEIVGDYILSLGVVGVISISILIVVCYFFPVISSAPIQVASGISYGLGWGTVHVALSVFIASQILFLFSRSLRVFSTKKQTEERLAIEEKIRNSRISIYEFVALAYLAPFIPFLIIHTIAANSGIKWWKYSLMTLLGTLPDIVVTLWAGGMITTSSSPIVSYVILIVIIIIVILSTVYKNKMVDFVFRPKKEKIKNEQSKQSDGQLSTTTDKQNEWLE